MILVSKHTHNCFEGLLCIKILLTFKRCIIYVLQLLCFVHVVSTDASSATSFTGIKSPMLVFIWNQRLTLPIGVRHSRFAIHGTTRNWWKHNFLLFTVLADSIRARCPKRIFLISLRNQRYRLRD